MLTTSAAGRVFDFSHVVGGRQITGIVNLAFGEGDDVYMVKKAAGFTDVLRLSVGPEPGDEEVTARFSDVNDGFFRDAWPACVAVGPDSDVYVTDELRHLVSVFDRDGLFLRHVGEHGTGEGQFDRPSGIVFNKSGRMLVVDTLNHRVQELTTDGEFINAWGSHGSEEGQFRSPWGITVDGDGDVYVADHKNHRIQKFGADGAFKFALGSYGSEKGQFDHPSDVAVDPDGDIYVCDWVNNRVQVFDSEGGYVSELNGAAIELSKWQKQYVRGNPDVYKARRRVSSLDPETVLALPTGVQFDVARSRLFIVDSQRWRIQIFNKLDDYSEPQFNI
ncbi:MAG: NHL repeat-containing protein [Chloroflexi bacterium]|nr:NHL repeat-containing protein [Chloroflexota bacterium]